MPGVEKRTEPDGTEIDVEYDYAEIIYENGEHSVAPFFQDDVGKETFLAALKIHTDRARAGLPSGPMLPDGSNPLPASRVKRVLVYPDHPALLSAPAYATKEVIKKYVNDAFRDFAPNDDGEYPTIQVLDYAKPKPLVNTAPHESNYPAQESEELDPKLWGGDA